MVEQLFCKQQVVGPNPTLGSTDAGMPEWTIGMVCKTIARKGYEGSNPSPSTNFLTLCGLENFVMEMSESLSRFAIVEYY